MDREDFKAFWNNHARKIYGVLLGLIVGILFLTIGVWKTLFIVLCMAVGYFLVGVQDKGEKIRAFLAAIGLRKEE
jgi:uncharacterized membrane protein